MRGQLTAIPDWFYYFAGLADKLEGTTILSDKANFLVYTRLEPAGVVAAIVPRNSPLLLRQVPGRAPSAEGPFIAGGDPPGGAAAIPRLAPGSVSAL
jgi:Aldehyde dehydrogenase family